MNSNDEESLRRLLEEMLPPGGADCGPDRAAVLAMVRRRRVRRQWLRGGVVGGLLLGALTLCLPWPGPEKGALVGNPAAPAPVPLVVEEVSDAELLAILEDTPAALIEWPNGTRTLLVVEGR